MEGKNYSEETRKILILIRRNHFKLFSFLRLSSRASFIFVPLPSSPTFTYFLDERITKIFTFAPFARA